MTASPKYSKELEKAIADKFGAETCADPSIGWTADMERELQESLRSKKFVKTADHTIIIRDGIEIVGGRNEGDTRTCRFCGKFSFASRDAVYLTRWQCCAKCYVLKVEGRLNGSRARREGDIEVA